MNAINVISKIITSKIISALNILQKEKNTIFKAVKDMKVKENVVSVNNIITKKIMHAKNPNA